MRIVSIRTLRNRLRDYLQLVKSGEIVLVTEKDRVIAEITLPAGGRRSMEPNALLAQAIRDGKITPPAVRSREAPPRRPVMPLRELLDELSEDRKTP